MAETKYGAQWYESEESHQSYHAATPREELWRQDPGLLFDTLEQALEVAKGWMTTGHYKTSRVVEFEDGTPTSVHWMSVWEKPIEPVSAQEKGATGVPGYACKVQVWMDRDAGPPDHWPFWTEQGYYWHKIFEGNSNAWDLEYGRAVDKRGRKVLWSLKLNLWTAGKKHPSQWAWWKIMEKDEEEQDDVEFVRAHDIEPREFPASEELAECDHCGKVHLKKFSWVAYNPEADKEEYFDRCFCIDARLGPEVYRMTPDGDEFEDPGCVVIREKENVAF